MSCAHQYLFSVMAKEMCEGLSCLFIVKAVGLLL